MAGNTSQIGVTSTRCSGASQVDCKEGRRIRSQLHRPPTTKSGIKGAGRSIAIAVAISTIPLVAIPTILLVLVGLKSVTRNYTSLPALSLPIDDDDPSAYLVDFSATQLTTLASWASTTATLIPGFLVSLCMYTVAAAMIRESDAANAEGLPSPYQLSMLIEASNGGLASLWNWISYLFWKRRESINSVFRFTLITLALSITLVYLIWAADTWLHVTTSTVIFSNILNRTEYPDSSYGTALVPQCAGFDFFLDPFGQPPGFEVAGTSLSCFNVSYDHIIRSSYGYAILNNISATNQSLLTAYYNGSGAEVSFIVHNSPLPSNLDFIASSFGYSASCMPVSTACDLRFIANSTVEESGYWNCTPGFSGMLPGDGTTGSYSELCSEYGSGCFGVYSNSTFSAAPYGSGSEINPLFVGLSAQMYGINSTGQWNATETLSNDDSIFFDFILTCQVSVSDIEFSHINGSINILSSTPANDSVTILSTSWRELGLSNIAVGNAINVAAAASLNMQETSEKFAASLAKIFAAFSADAFMEGNTIMEQARETKLVSRVPKAPLFALTALCFLMSILGAVLGIVALCSPPSATRDVQARLSIKGLMATHFEKEDQQGARVSALEDTFAERKGLRHSCRVGVVRTDQGGWIIESFSSGGDSLLGTVVTQHEDIVTK